ncbi:MAG TPA: ATP-binding protein [Tepidisphaeraceae bacterium]|nr:ATP-binding protein [Tepidisphaeraceae bacterium]
MGKHVKFIFGRFVASIPSWSLRARLVAAALLVISPIIILAVSVLGGLSASLLQSSARQDLVQASDSVANAIEQWDLSLVLVLQNLQGEPDIAGMNPDLQRPVIEQMKKVYDRLEIVRTTRPNGLSLVRTDGDAPVNYADRAWFKACMAGAPIYREVLITRTSGKPALNMSVPIRDRKTGKVVGVLSALKTLASMPDVLGTSLDGFACGTIVTDEHGRALLDTTANTASHLRDLSHFSPVRQALGASPGDLDFTDSSGARWLSHSIRLANGWVVVAVVSKASAMAGGAAVMRLAYFLAAGAILATAVLTWIIATRLLTPIQELTGAATRLADGDWSQRVPERHNDEVGRLARAFNHMANQLEQAYRNIEEQVRARTEKLESVTQELVKTARRAGMAEIATGVLHNVGNVLNSINVSLDVAIQKLHQSEVASLTRAGDLLRQHSSDLPHFLTDDQRGRHLPSFLMELADCLRTEQTQLLAELDRVGTGVAHIKQIVSAQQNHARDGMLRERVDPSELFDQAISLSPADETDSSLTIVRDYPPIDAAALDKHKVLQILINLLSNARRAAQTGRRPGTITVATRLLRHADGNRIQFEVRDNGIGIAAEHLTQIFAHGFTTDTDGHGFGLHSSANAAREMGGNLTASSGGLDQGATFVLDLPLAELTAAEEMITRKKRVA